MGTSDIVKPLAITCAAVAVCTYLYARSQAVNEKKESVGKLSKDELKAKLAAHQVNTPVFLFTYFQPRAFVLYECVVGLTCVFDSFLAVLFSSNGRFS